MLIVSSLWKGPSGLLHTSLGHGGRTAAWLILLCLIPLSPALGSVAGVAALLFACSLVGLLSAPGSRHALGRQPAIIIFVVVFVALASSFAITATEASSLLYAANFLSLLLAAPVYLAALQVSDGRAAAASIFILCLAAALASALVAVNDVVLSGLDRAAGHFMGGNLLARLALLFGFLSLGGFFVSRSPWRLIFVLGPLSGFLVTYYTGTRGAALQIPILMLVVVVAAAARRNWRTVWLLAALSLAAAAIFAFGRLNSMIAIMHELFVGGGISDSSSAQRLEMLGAAWRAFLQAPLVGHGWSGFARTASPFLDLSIYGGPDDPYFQFHNDLANFAVAAGLVGVGSLVALLVAPIHGLLRSPRDPLFSVRAYCVAQLVVAYAISGITDFTFGYDLPTTIYAFLTVIVLGAFQERGEQTMTEAAGVAPTLERK